MAPAVGGKLPAVVPQALCHFGSSLAVLLVGFRAGIGGGSAITEDALVSGKG